jgi:hypothetical protein
VGSLLLLSGDVLPLLRVAASSAAEPVPDSSTAESRQWPAFLTLKNDPRKSISSRPRWQPGPKVAKARKTAPVALPKLPAPYPNMPVRRSARLSRLLGE